MGQAVLFDMDGLLLDSERPCLETFNETVADLGMPAMPEVFLATVGLRSAASAPIIATGLNGRVECAVFNAHWRRLLMARYDLGISVKAGALELLTMLKADGAKIAVATSTRFIRAKPHLENAGLWGFVDEIVCGDQVKNGKPDPESYFTAAAKLRADITDCYIFEDSDTGILAAVRSGGCAVQVPDLKQPSSETIALGHIIAPDLMTGARMAGLID